MHATTLKYKDCTIRSHVYFIKVQYDNNNPILRYIWCRIMLSLPVNHMYKYYPLIISPRICLKQFSSMGFPHHRHLDQIVHMCWEHNELQSWSAFSISHWRQKYLLTSSLTHHRFFDRPHLSCEFRRVLSPTFLCLAQGAEPVQVHKQVKQGSMSAK